MVLDILFLVIAAYGFYTGFSRGIIRAVLGVLAILFGFMVAVRFAPMMAGLLQSAFNMSSTVVFLIGFVLCFLITMTIIHLIAKGLENILASVNLNILNKIAGGVLMGALFVFGFSVLVWFGDRMQIISDEQKSISFSYPLLKAFPGHVNDFRERITPQVKKAFDESTKKLDELKEKSEDN